MSAVRSLKTVWFTLLMFAVVIMIYLCLLPTTAQVWDAWMDGNKLIMNRFIGWKNNETSPREMEDDTPSFYGISERKRWNKVYMNTEHHFMHCLIQKNANSMFRNLWFAVSRNAPFIYRIETRQNRSDSTEPFHENIDIYWLDQRVILNVDDTHYLQKVVDPKWTKMVIIRDPLERVN